MPKRDLGNPLILDVVGEAEMVAFGASLGKAIRPYTTITLEGDLGAGKTTLSRGLLHYLGHKGPVKSPTFTLVEPYNLECGNVYHFDLYRFKSPEEWLAAGFNDHINTRDITIIEWPEKIINNLPSDSVIVKILFTENEDQRKIMLYSTGSKSKKFINKIK